MWIVGRKKHFVRVGELPELILLAVPEENDLYVLVQFMEKRVRTVTADIVKHVNEIHTLNSCFSLQGLKEAQAFH